MLVSNTRANRARELARKRAKARSECDFIVYGVGKEIEESDFSKSSKPMVVELLQLPFLMVPQWSNARSDGWLLGSFISGLITSKPSHFVVEKSGFALLISMLERLCGLSYVIIDNH
jgi:hypothetical protein